MSTLDSLFGGNNSGGAGSSPLVKFDYEKETLRFRVGLDLNEMLPLIRHYVKGVGYVKCNQKPYIRRADGAKMFYGREEYACVFCDERRAFKKQIDDKAAAEGRKLTKEENDAYSALHKRHIQLATPVKVEVRQKGKVVQELADKVILFRAQDMFFANLNQNYKTLSSIYEMRGTLKNSWLTMTGNGTIMIDDPLTEAEKAEEFTASLDYFEKQTKDYATGEGLWNKLLGEVTKVEKVDHSLSGLEKAELLDPDLDPDDVF